ncbi:MAG: nucleotidyltransferase family protein [Thermoanaerobaculia bacterium]
MNAQAIRSGGILAAGEGSRLRQAGWPMAKPLVPVAGVPLIEHVIENFAAAGVTTLAIIFNEQEEDCARWVRARFPDLELRILVQTTASSLESFQRIAPLLESGSALVSTVDAFCPRQDFLSFVEAAAKAPPEATVLAVTPFVDDERPLWASLDAAGRMKSLGGDSGDVVTAGLYVFPERVRRLSPPATVGRLREFLAWLLERGETLYGFSIEKVVDVDRSSDVALAETLARSAARQARRTRAGHS